MLIIKDCILKIKLYCFEFLLNPSWKKAIYYCPDHYSARNQKNIQVVPISKAGQPNPWIWLP